MAFIQELDSPVVLGGGRVSLPVNGGPLQVSMNPLQSRSRNWLELRGIRFYIEPTPTETAESYVQFGKAEYGMLIDAQISIGKYDITQDYVALAMMNPRVQALYRRMSQSYIVAGAVPDTLGLTTNGVDFRFPRPMLVPPGVVIDINLQRATRLSGVDTYSQPFTVEAVVYGKKLAQKPDKRSTHVPYIACHQPKLPSGGSYQNLWQTQAQPRFANPFQGKPLNVERFVCRAFGAGVVTDWESMPRVLISDSNRKAVIDQTYPQPQYAPRAIATQTPFLAYPGGDRPQGTVLAPTVFTRAWETWRVDSILDPNQYYVVSLEQQFLDAPVAATLPIPWLSMIGSREETV